MAPAAPAQVGCPASAACLDLAEGREAVACMSGVITRIASQSRGGVTTRFDCVYPPDVSVHEYLTRLYDHMRCSPECYVLSMIYINRLMELNSELALSVTNVHRLLLTTVVVAAKFFDDKYCANDYYARIGGLATKELNSLEARFLEMVGWKVYVSQEECLECLQSLRSLGGSRSCEFRLRSAFDQGDNCDLSSNTSVSVEEDTASVSSIVHASDIDTDMGDSDTTIDGRSTPKVVLKSVRLTKRSPIKTTWRCRSKMMRKGCALEFSAGQDAFVEPPRCDLRRPIERPKQRLRIIVVP